MITYTPYLNNGTDNETGTAGFQPVPNSCVANTAPTVANVIAPQSATVGLAYSYVIPTNTFTDNETPTSLTLTVGGLPAGLSFTAPATISGTPTTATGSPFTVTVTATDPGSLSVATTVTFTINANQAPVASTVTNQTATVGTLFSYTIPAFTDAENQTLTYAATGVPSPLTFDPATRIISGTPSTTSVSAITITATDPSSNTVSATFSLTVNAAGPSVIISEVHPAGSGNGTYAADWFEVTNTGSSAVNITGWKIDDNSNSFSLAVGLSGITSIAPGQSVIFLEGGATEVTKFLAAWFGGTLPSGVQVGTYSGSGVGLSATTDAVNLFDASGNRVTGISFGSANSTTTFDNSAGAGSTTLPLPTVATLSMVGVNGGSKSFDAREVGSPGAITNTVLPFANIATVGASGTVVANATASEAGSTTATFRIARTGALTNALTVNYAVVTGSGQATNGVDYTPALTGTAIITAGQSFVDITITVVDDASIEGNETVTLTLVANANYTINSAATSVTLIDNDSNAPTIQVANTTTPYLNLPASSPGYVSGVAGDPTDPATTLGVNFTLTDPDTDVNSLTVTLSSNNAAVAPIANLNLTGTGGTRNLKITPAGVGYATITVAVSDGSNTTNYLINYAGSAASATQNTTTTRFHTGTSDASTAVLVDANYTLVGDDENQVLRLYNRQNSGLPVAGFDYTSSLGLTDLSGGVPREVDIEASIRQNNRIFWIGSQSNKELGPARPNRDRVFATDISGTGANTTLTYVGRYDYLKEDIVNWDVTNGHGKGANYYGLATSAGAATNSKAPEGYNIEGAELGPDGTTAYIGFRAPQILPASRTKALIVAVTNLTSLVNGSAQGSATFGAPIELDLGGRGIREIRKNANNDYVIIAGPAGDATGTAPSDFRLYTWTGNAADAPVIRVTSPVLTSLNANGSFESIVEVPNPLTSTSQLQLLVDNGDAVYYGDGTIAKDLAQNNFKKFRSDIVTLGAPVNTAPTVANVIPPQSATVGQAFTYTLPANTFTDAETPGQLTVSVVGLPTGLNFTAPATISGTPSTTTGSPFSVTVTATDPSSLSVSTTFAFTIQPAPVVITSLSLVASASPTAILTTGTTTLSATVSGGTTPYSYIFNGPGTITPSGNTATVSGLMAGVQTFMVIASDATTPTAQTLSATVSVTVTTAPVAPTAPALTNQTAMQGTPFSYVVPAFSGTAPIVYTASGLPNGLSFDANSRTISGTPTTVQTPTVTISASNVAGQSSGQFTIAVSASATQPTGPATLTITSFTCVTTNAVLTGVNFVVGYSDGTFTPAVPNLFINGITITGQLGVQYGLTFDANQSELPIADNASRQVYFVWNYRQACAAPVTPPAPVAPTAPALPNQTAVQGTPFSYVVPAFSGTAPIVYTAANLPNGLSFDASTRTISGTPTTVQTPTVSISASNVAGQSSGTFTIAVSASAVQPTGPATLTITSFTCTTTNAVLTGVNFVVGYSDGTFSPAVPNLFINGITITGQLGVQYGLTFDANQSELPIADNASRQVYFVWNYRAACAAPVTPPAPVAPTAPALPNQTATQGTPFSYVVPAFSGTAPIVYTAANLPNGLSFDASTRTISGTPTTVQTPTVTISASNVAGQSSGTFTIAVSASATQPTGPATLTITSFTCVTTNSVLTGVNFVVGYSDGTFSPAVPNLFINGITITGQLGVQYGLTFDANQSELPIADNASRQVYFVWNYRQACAAPVTPPAPVAPTAPALPNQTATQGTPFSYVVPAFSGTAPIVYTAANLPNGLSFDASTRTISGIPTTVQTPTVSISASNVAGQSSGTFTIAVSASAVQPTGPATLTITSFTCTTTNAVLTGVNFVVGYSDGTFSPAVPNLFINGITITGQLGTQYGFSFDANQSNIAIQDQDTRSTYFVWNYRAACTARLGQGRLSAEPSLPLQISVLGNPVGEAVTIDVRGVEGKELLLQLIDVNGVLLEDRHVGRAAAVEQQRFDVRRQPAGVILLRATAGQQTQTVKVLKK